MAYQANSVRDDRLSASLYRLIAINAAMYPASATSPIILSNPPKSSPCEPYAVGYLLTFGDTR